jgi:hypothetical protein
MSMTKAGPTYFYYTLDYVEPIRICGKDKTELKTVAKSMGKNIDNVKSDEFVKGITCPPRK